MNIIKKSVFVTSLALGALALVSPALSVAEETSCIPTDVKGDFQYSGNHLSGNPVTGLFDNIATDASCSDDIYIHVFGSNQEPETDGWLESQSHVTTETYTIPQGQTGYQVSMNLPTSDYCWYQVDATRTSEVRIPPTYNGNDMISYVFVKNREVCGEVTPTPTATPSATPTPTTENNGGGSTHESPKTVESIQKTIENTTMAPTGLLGNAVMNIMGTVGSLLTVLGTISLRKQKSA
jgi:hypothetical protein